MRHQKKGRKLHRERNQRTALLKGLAVHLILRGKIKTTLAKAKETRPFIERLVTYAKNKKAQEGYRSLRYVLPAIAAHKMIQDIAPKYQNRAGGYTRIIKAGLRKGDAADMAYIEFI